MARRYQVMVYAQQGEVLHEIAKVEIEAPNKKEAQRAALDMVWQARLRAKGLDAATVEPVFEVTHLLR